MICISNLLNFWTKNWSCLALPILLAAIFYAWQSPNLDFGLICKPDEPCLREWAGIALGAAAALFAAGNLLFLGRQVREASEHQKASEEIQLLPKTAAVHKVLALIVDSRFSLETLARISHDVLVKRQFIGIVEHDQIKDCIKKLSKIGSERSFEYCTTEVWYVDDGPLLEFFDLVSKIEALVEQHGITPETASERPADSTFRVMQARRIAMELDAARILLNTYLGACQSQAENYLERWFKIVIWREGKPHMNVMV